MRLLMASPFPVAGPFGYSRVIRGVAHGLRHHGHTVSLVGPEEIGADASSWWNDRPGQMRALREYFRAHAAEYDVFEYDHEFLPYPRSELDPSVLFVARAALLTQHKEWVRFPRRWTLRSAAARLVRQRARARADAEEVRVADETVRNADVVNVGNEDDRRLLVRRGIANDRILVAPYAIAPEILSLFEERSEPPSDPRIAFVGTFDYRKGAVHFPGILRRVSRQFPAARLRLLGTKGLFPDASSVLSFFPRHLRERIEVVPSFEPEKLPSLLDGCSLGIFPSYWEGFGFGVLEMMAAWLPVVAFDAPGPPMMVPADLLVAPGDEAAMAAAVLALLRDPDRLRAERRRAAEISMKFRWERIGELTATAYESARAQLPPR